jgi:corrinoid protein of di/trimethylamine methyltransferase
MPLEGKVNELLKKIQEAIVAYDEEKCAQLCNDVLAQGVDAHIAITEGLAAGMKTVGELYQKKEYFVPELLLCSDALYAGLSILQPHLRLGQIKVKGKLIIGTVEGDIHDIGKNLVKTMFEAAGWDVHDLGKDVKLERFVEEQKTFNADMVALSALMTTSMMGVPKVIGMLRSRTPGVKIIVGGAPFTQCIAKQYGADGYAADAVAAVSTGVSLFENKV